VGVAFDARDDGRASLRSPLGPGGTTYSSGSSSATLSRMMDSALELWEDRRRLASVAVLSISIPHALPRSVVVTALNVARKAEEQRSSRSAFDAMLLVVFGGRRALLHAVPCSGRHTPETPYWLSRAGKAVPRSRLMSGGAPARAGDAWRRGSVTKFRPAVGGAYRRRHRFGRLAKTHLPHRRQSTPARRLAHPQSIKLKQSRPTA
jgi:hypothetical protein